MLLGTLGASLLGNLLSGKGTTRAGEGIVRAGYGSSIRKNALIPPHLLMNFEIEGYFLKTSVLMVFILEITYLKQ